MKNPDAYCSELTAVPSHSLWNPLHWPTWAKVLAVTGIISAGVGIGVGVSEAEKNAGAYPDYTALNYTLKDAYYGDNFFDNFDYFTAADPTDGFVQYVSAEVSAQYNLTYATSSTALLRVDTSNTDAANGRYSVRITSKNTYDTGLFIFDITHSPYGCSTWPSIWLADPSNWPDNGEIDVLEAVEQANVGNAMTLHTTDDCTMNVRRKETGDVVRTNCWNATDYNDGCGVQGADDTYGEKFNANGGGIYAMELRAAGIRIWMFARDSIPTDLSDLAANSSSATPDPSAWGEALADFPSTDCDISTHFKNQSIIANIDICGTWAGQTAVFADQYGCPGTCDEFAQYNASAFDTAYWQWNGFWVFSAEGA